MSPHIVYGLIDPLTQELKYVGKSSSGLIRPQQHGRPGHLAKDNNIKKVLWIQGLHDIGLNYEIEVLEECSSMKATTEKEKFWIAYYNFLGAEMFNLTKGGEGGRKRLWNVASGQMEMAPAPPTPSKRPYKEELAKWTRGYFVSAIHAIAFKPSFAKLSALTGIHRSTVYEVMAAAHLDIERALTESPPIAASDMKPFKEAKNEWKKRYLEEILTASSGSISVASDISGMHRSTIYQLGSELDIGPTLETAKLKIAQKLEEGKAKLGKRTRQNKGSGTSGSDSEEDASGVRTATINANAADFKCPHCGIETVLRFADPMGVPV